MLRDNPSDLAAIYGDDYQSAWLADSERSAAVVVPLLLGHFPWVRSVLDVGCGPAAWLLKFQIDGVPRVLGLDGVRPARHLLQIDPQFYRQVDFREAFAPPEPFDLTISLETADCLPEARAEHFVAQLARSSDLIVFGAATPGQSGRADTNERWPSYWVSLFSDQGFQHFDMLRAPLWYDQRVSWWYAQNTFVFVRRERTDIVERLSPLCGAEMGPLDIVHPRAFAWTHDAVPVEKAEEERFYPFKLLETGFEGFNILEIAGNKFLALHQSEGEYRPEKLLSGLYGRSYVADSVLALKALVVARQYPPERVVDGYRGFDIYRMDSEHFVAISKQEGEGWVDKFVNFNLDRAYFGSSIRAVKRKVPALLWLRSLFKH